MKDEIQKLVDDLNAGIEMAEQFQEQYFDLWKKGYIACAEVVVTRLMRTLKEEDQR